MPPRRFNGPWKKPANYQLRPWSYISRNPDTNNWMVGNSQMAKFKIEGDFKDYSIAFKRGGRILEIMEEAQWLVKAGATNVLIDGVQNSIREILAGKINLEGETLEKLKEMNKKATVILTEVLYCPELAGYEAGVHRINRQIRKMNKTASGLVTPKPWIVLTEKKRNCNRKKKDIMKNLPGAFRRDGYHISDMMLPVYEEYLSKTLSRMIYIRISDVCFPKPERKDEFIKKKTKYDYLNVIEID